MSAKDDDKSGNELLVTGVSVGAIGVAGAVLLGATCPICVVATPALIGAGLYKKWRAKRDVAALTSMTKGEPSEAPAPGPETEEQRS